MKLFMFTFSCLIPSWVKDFFDFKIHKKEKERSLTSFEKKMFGSIFVFAFSIIWWGSFLFFCIGIGLSKVILTLTRKISKCRGCKQKSHCAKEQIYTKHIHQEIDVGTHCTYCSHKCHSGTHCQSETRRETPFLHENSPLFSPMTGSFKSLYQTLDRCTCDRCMCQSCTYMGPRGRYTCRTLRCDRCSCFACRQELEKWILSKHWLHLLWPWISIWGIIIYFSMDSHFEAKFRQWILFVLSLSIPTTFSILVYELFTRLCQIEADDVIIKRWKGYAYITVFYLMAIGMTLAAQRF